MKKILTVYYCDSRKFLCLCNSLWQCKNNNKDVGSVGQDRLFWITRFIVIIIWGPLRPCNEHLVKKFTNSCHMKLSLSSFPKCFKLLQHIFPNKNIIIRNQRMEIEVPVVYGIWEYVIMIILPDEIIIW